MSLPNKFSSEVSGKCTRLRELKKHARHVKMRNDEKLINLSNRTQKRCTYINRRYLNVSSRFESSLWTFRETIAITSAIDLRFYAPKSFTSFFLPQLFIPLFPDTPNPEIHQISAYPFSFLPTNLSNTPLTNLPQLLYNTQTLKQEKTTGQQTILLYLSVNQK